MEALVNDYILYEHGTLGKRAKVLIIFPTYVVRSFLSQFFFKKKEVRVSNSTGLFAGQYLDVETRLRVVRVSKSSKKTKTCAWAHVGLRGLEYISAVNVAHFGRGACSANFSRILHW